MATLLKFDQQLEEKLRQLIDSLWLIHEELKAGSALDEKLLYEFREALDEARLASWTAQELVNLKRQKEDPERFLSLLATERLRRCEEMVASLSADIDSGDIPTGSTDQIESLRNRLETLKTKLTGTS